MQYKYQTDKYLDETELGKLLNHLFGEHNVIRNKGFPSNKMIRPDYRIDSHKLVIEFDGPRHYTQASVIMKDRFKDSAYKEAGYKIIRFPFFIQPTVKLFNKLSDLSFPDDEFCFTYPQGFIDKNVVIPADFCVLGVERFIKDLDTFKEFQDDILESLLDKCDQQPHWLFVLPPEFSMLFPSADEIRAELEAIDSVYEEIGDEYEDADPYDGNYPHKYYYESYTRMGGKDTIEGYAAKNDKFQELTSDTFINGCNKLSREEAIELVEKIYGVVETYRIFKSIDVVTGYT